MEIDARLTGRPTHNGDGYWGYEIEVTVGDETQFLECWKLASFLEAGASCNLDGSGLALYGNSQPGGWVCLDSDGADTGAPRARIGAGGVEVLTPNESILFDLPDGTDLEEVLDQLEKELELVAAEADLDEPNAYHVWDELGSWAKMDHLPVRIGRPYGSRAVWIAWLNYDGVYQAEEWDWDAPEDLERVALAKLAEDLNDAASRARDM